MAEDKAEILSAVRDVYPQINETLEAVVLDGSMNTLLKVPVSEVIKRLNSAEGGKLLVIDGIVTQRLVDPADKAGIGSYCWTPDDRLEKASRYPNQDI